MVDNNNEGSLKLGWGKAWVQANGLLSVILVLFLCLAAVNASMVLYHHWGIAELHTAMTKGLEQVQRAQERATDAQIEGNYIHTLTDVERNALCLEMPLSLKAKIRDGYNVKRC